MNMNKNKQIADQKVLFALLKERDTILYAQKIRPCCEEYPPIVQQEEKWRLLNQEILSLYHLLGAESFKSCVQQYRFSAYRREERAMA